MTPQEATDFVESLEESREELLASAANVPEGQANTKPESGRWSVLECLEHVTIAEEKLLARLEAAQPLEQLTVDKRKEAELAIRIPNRAVRAEAPEAVRPTGQIAGLAEALQRFSAARSRTIHSPRRAARICTGYRRSTLDSARSTARNGWSYWRVTRVATQSRFEK